DASHQLNNLFSMTPESQAQGVHGEAAAAAQPQQERVRSEPATAPHSAVARQPETGQPHPLEGRHSDQPAVSPTAPGDPATRKTNRVAAVDDKIYTLRPLKTTTGAEPVTNDGNMLARPLGVSTSQMYIPSTGGGPALVDGVPLAEGYEILGAREIEKGVVRLDVNGNESIVPLGEDQSLTPTDVPPIGRGGATP